MATSREEKEKKLAVLLEKCMPLAVAFSGGVDSTYLLHEAAKAGKEKVTALIMKTPSVPERELDEAVAFCKSREFLFSFFRRILFRLKDSGKTDGTAVISVSIFFFPRSLRRQRKKGFLLWQTARMRTTGRNSVPG